MHDGTLRYMSVGVLLYLITPIIVVYGVFAAISAHGGLIIDWAFQQAPAISDTRPPVYQTASNLSPESIRLLAISHAPVPQGKDLKPFPALTSTDDAAPQRRDDRYTQVIDRTLPMDDDGRLELENLSGNITVTTWDRSEARIKATKTASASNKEDAEEDLAEVLVEIDARRGDVSVFTDYPDRRSRRWGNDNINVSVHYDVTVPLNASMRVKSISGNVEVSKSQGEVEASSVSGNVLLSEINNRIRGSSVSGSVEARDLVGETDLQSVSGHVEVSRLTGDIEASSTSGGVDMRDVTADRVYAKSVSGTLRFQGPIRRNGRYELESMSGGVRMTIPEDSAFELRAKTFSGSINSDLPITMRGSIPTRKGRQKRLDGTVNGGGATVEISAFSGSIDIRTR